MPRFAETVRVVHRHGLIQSFRYGLGCLVTKSDWELLGGTKYDAESPPQNPWQFILDT